MYRTFRDKEDACIKVVMKPDAPAAPTDRPRMGDSWAEPGSGHQAKD
jgi:hypothetical protein